MEFGPSTSFTEASPTFVIDADQNPATGFAGITDTHLDAALIGAEYVLTINASSFQANASLLGVSGGIFSLGTFAVSYTGPIMLTSLNLTSLGGDDGLMNFKVLAQRQISAASWTAIQDFMSELGQPVGVVVAVPEANIWAIVGLGLLSLLAVRGRQRLMA